MGWKVELDTEKGFIHSVYYGFVTKDEILRGTAETLRLSAGKGPRKFFTEWIDATPKLSTMEIFVIPDEWEAAGIDRKSVLAIVIPKGGSLWEDAVFYEDTCRNRGWQVRLFSERNSAIEWLETFEIG